jgi:general stress protein 26
VDDTDSELLQALVQGFDRAMLVTRYGDAMRSRPTTIANTGDRTRLWLLSGIVGDRLDDLSRDRNVNVVMQDGLRFCSVTGTARIARPTGEESIWNDRQRAWLAHGERRASLVLVEVVPQYAEYWDRSGVRGLRFEAGTADEHSEAPLWRSGAQDNPQRDNVIRVEQSRWKRSCVTSST